MFFMVTYIWYLFYINVVYSFSSIFFEIVPPYLLSFVQRDKKCPNLKGIRVPLYVALVSLLLSLRPKGEDILKYFEICQSSTILV